ncbi:hypothetical protein DEU56DRAFT_880080 [Suillus clintonianus]|uniref:uncharacterized protein n=1 Tax=Suillus clintonianus TaxID=1904413 RepID=UPI001B877D78|nr:uncharacterized protein DEU56DRAFT_880080 [Suillus clintonianus]KAG2151420.1 hypothetical protein DEU56DRAFT_880080 [Suillus clintonianus]
MWATTKLGMSNTTGDLAKLTVSQLKALCKQRRIVGYSKLGKAALVQKLTNNDATRGDPQPVISIRGISEKTAPEHTCHPAVLAPARSTNTGVTALDHTHNTQTANGDLTATSAEQPTQHKALPVPGLVDPSAANHHSKTTVVAPLSSDAPNESHGTKRPYISAMFKSAKRQKPSPANAVSICGADSSNSTKSSTSAGILNARTGLTFATDSESPAAAGRPPHDSSFSSNTVPIIALRNTHLVQKGSTTTSQGRFKPLVFTTTPIVASIPVTAWRVSHNDHQANKITFTPSDIFSFEAAPNSTPSFVNITFPPKLSDRKRVQRWAVILAALTDKDRRTCILVSRAFRYAVYLSAAHILTQKYHGRRLNHIVKSYPQNTTNMWPYLRQRQNEVAFWRHAFQNSFVGRYNSTLGIDPLSTRLWASADDEKQVVVALRFVLTRLWFTLSVGTNERDPSAWLKRTVENAQEVVKGEIWAITIRDGNSLSEFYVLESTCEVIGRGLNAPQLEVYSSGLRADWSKYISSYPGPSAESRNLISEHLRWANYEEYDRGISRHWLRRISGEGDVGLSKKVVAERYVMACVVANSVSGQWMSSNQMAQEFAGLPSQVTHATTRGGIPKINLYLPAHHHVESVHFTTSKGVPLHPALAVMQTPAREYIVLKDNGMQVGCEEDGVANVWMNVLGCDKNGIAVVRSK